MSRLKLFLKWICIVCFMGIGLLYFFQNKIIFQPEKLPKNFIYTFDHVFEEFYLETNDSVKLNAIHFKNEAPNGVILYFHGNKGNLARWGRITSFFAQKNYDVIVMDYRTYGKSGGTITETNLYTDAQQFYNYTLKQYPEKDIIVYGRSLGTGIASKIASENQPRNLILETPYYSMEDLVSGWLPIIPIRHLVKYKFPSNKHIKEVRCPITIFHGTADKIVPYSSGLKLYNTTTQLQKNMVTIDGGKHNDLVDHPEYLMHIDTALNKY